MLDKINLNLLRSLYILLDECHVSQAAHRMNISQSAVSRQLAQLRELFSDPLLVRDGNHLYPTPKAIELKDKLSRLFAEFDSLLEDDKFEPQHWRGKLTFASSDYVAEYIFPELAENITSLAPAGQLEYVMWQPEWISELADSKVHLASAMLPEAPEGLSSRFLGQDSPVIVMKESHPLTNKEDLSLEDVLAFPHIVVTGGSDKDIYFDKALSSLGLSRNIALRLPFFSSALNTLSRSEHLLVIPEHIAKSLSRDMPIVYKALPLSLPVQKYWLVWHPKYDTDPAHQWLRDKVFQALIQSEYSIGYNLQS